MHVMIASVYYNVLTADVKHLIASSIKIFKERINKQQCSCKQ